MPNNREAFETWAKPILGDNPTWRESADCELAWQAWQAGEQHERESTITVANQSQDWKGMDGTTAFHLITRHADGWSDVGKMMGEWLEANRDRSAP